MKNRHTAKLRNRAGEGGHSEKRSFSGENELGHKRLETRGWAKHPSIGVEKRRRKELQLAKKVWVFFSEKEPQET